MPQINTFLLSFVALAVLTALGGLRGRRSESDDSARNRSWTS